MNIGDAPTPPGEDHAHWQHTAEGWWWATSGQTHGPYPTAAQTQTAVTAATGGTP